jgi:amidase
VSDHLHPVPTAVDTAEAVRSGRHTARYAVEQSLARIAARDGEIRAFTVVRAEQALAEADALDAGGPGHDGPLAGVPVAVKEEYDVTGHVTTLGGRGNSTPAQADSEVIRRLRSAGAIIVGKTAMPEFGQFPHTESLRYGRTHNPVDLTRSAGGSSGGSGTAAAMRVIEIVEVFEARIAPGFIRGASSR